MHKLHIAEELNRQIQLLLGYLRIACGLQQQADEIALIDRKDLGVLVILRVLVYDDQLGALGGFRKGLAKSDTETAISESSSSSDRSLMDRSAYSSE